ncbi:ATP-binding protein [uncultured Paludibaculum sp.]|uniref:PAS domain-containing sensor histidine kinase n=1 Tax=uncultured Paludibaculum sp. TaxID=1765020 RepID=UPI002AAAB7FA|nr:ATP-binding protein [uncultured Paludibaculum sp.]
MKHGAQSGSLVNRNALRIVLIYLFVAGLWILGSDEVAARLFPGKEAWLKISVYKGLLFVFTTSLLLYLLLRRTFASMAKSSQALEESQRLFVSFMDHLPVGAFLKAGDGTYVFANEFWRRHFYPHRDLEGVRSSDLFPPETVVAFQRDDQATIEHGRIKERNFVLTLNGKVTEWMVKKFPVTLEGGKMTLVGGVAMEITERRRLEEQLRQAAKMEAVGQLAGGVAHDFNNLLTVINGYAELLQVGQTDPAPAAAEIRKAGERAAALTRQLLAFSRRQVLKAEVLDLNTVVTGLESMLQRLIGAHISLNVSTDPCLRPVVADPSQLEQVIINMAVNARDAMPSGGSITLVTDQVEVSTQAEQDRLGVQPGVYVRLTISDTGEGMDDETRRRVFEPFFTTKEVGRGTGLGLSMVYGIVKQSQGTVQVESEPGVGTTFRVYLPAARETPPPPQAGENQSLFGSETILLIEDDESVRDLLAGLLRQRGYRVVQAHDCDDALQAIASAPGTVDLVVSDVIMPGIDGHEAARRLRAIEPGLKIMFVTGYSAEALGLRGLHDQGAVTLEKPFDLDTLSRAVRQALARA